MNYKINFGNGAFAVPSKITEAMDRATLSDVKVFLALCRLSGAEYNENMIVAMTDLSPEEIADSLTFWRGAGLLDVPREKRTRVRQEAKSVSDDSDAADGKGAKEKDAKKEESSAGRELKLGRTDELPSYNSDELARILEQRTELSTLIDECQTLIGKMFNVHEINKIIGLVDYLDLEYDYVLTLVAYCVQNEKKTLHYIEKTAFALYNSGITDTAALSEELRRREEFSGVEGEIRAMFGMGTRAFTAKEKKMIYAWIFDMKFSAEMIRQAYEITADATGKSSLPYANTVLERWHSEGIKTPEDVEQDKAKRASDKHTSKGSQSSFEVDEFFDAAIRRNNMN